MISIFLAVLNPPNLKSAVPAGKLERGQRNLRETEKNISKRHARTRRKVPEENWKTYADHPDCVGLESDSC